MGGAGGKKKGSNSAPGLSGKKLGNVNAKTMCKIDHLKNLALWAAAVPSLGTFIGERLVATSEALDLRGDPSLFVCERCESILQPGTNCTVRIEKNKSKVRRRRKKLNPNAQNNLVHRCHTCSHRSLMRGTPNGYVKEICPPKPKSTLQLKKARENCPSLENATTTTQYRKVDFDALLPSDEQNLETSSPEPTTNLSLLESKRRKRNRSSAKKVSEPQSGGAATNLEESINASSKRRKKSWTSLKEIAESSGQDIDRKLTDLTIPFFI
ncbi:hypothetical protein C2S52_008240 [Perilla frutescens var. hirtella]|nr:hypothetical protein C2S51_018023 [Perilla frutescens var. frutescens]KAH6783281.1 hypothetical protein C2S52_008240 [Perilla frutescens var. hirtella]